MAGARVDHLARLQVDPGHEHDRAVDVAEHPLRVSLVPDAVLAADHRQLRRRPRGAQLAEGRGRMLRLAREQHDVFGTKRRGFGNRGQRRHRQAVVGVTGNQPQAAGANRRRVRRARDQRDLAPGAVQMAAERSANRPGPENQVTHAASHIASAPYTVCARPYAPYGPVE